MRDLFGRENYEYYAKLTGRILKVEDEWIFFTYPPASYSNSEALEHDSDPNLGQNQTSAVLKSAVSTEEMDRLAPPAPTMIEKSGSLEIIPGEFEKIFVSPLMLSLTQRSAWTLSRPIYEMAPLF